jgi:hypothetical protein
LTEGVLPQRTIGGNRLEAIICSADRAKGLLAMQAASISASNIKNRHIYNKKGKR